jgi:hypothetical protein
MYVGVSKSSQTISHRPPTDGTTWKYALWVRAGSFATQCAKWLRCVNNGICTTRVFVTTCCHICHFSMDVKLEQQANIKFCVKLGKSWAEIFKCYDVRMVMRPCVVQRVSSGTRASSEAEHHSKMTRGQGDLPPAQPLQMWKQFGGLCTRIVR